MKQSSIPSARAVVSSLKERGVKQIIISPGSRNAPLTISFTEDSFFTCFSIVDERSAAFFALGMAQQQRSPVAVLCTSGSALLNYYPAVAEAFYSAIPLVVISADRPPYKIDVGDGQTIRQDHVFDRHIAYSANLKIDVEHAVERLSKYAPDLLETSQTEIDDYNTQELNKAFDRMFKKNTPIHINVPFEEPLYDTIAIREKGKAYFPEKVLKSDFKKEEMNGFKSIWASAKKKMVLVGVNHPNQVDQRLLDILANDPSVIVFTETTSNLHHPNFFPSIDSIIFPIEKSERRDTLFNMLRPDVLLTFGGLVVSKKIKVFLRKYQPGHHWHISENRAYDTYFSLSEHFKTTANNFLNVLFSEGSNRQITSDYFDTWNKVKLGYQLKRQSYLKEVPFSDYLVFYQLLKTIPEDRQLHLANSSTVRYAQLFDLHPSLKVFCNRGTSGIDGSTSTAVGASFYEHAQTVLITGDLSFFYDSNALWNNYIKKDFRIILINNSGGGIFRILPGNDESESFETYFETVQNQNAFHLSQQYGFEYTSADDVESLKNSLTTFYHSSEKPKILEVFTPRRINSKILLGYFDFIS